MTEELQVVGGRLKTEFDALPILDELKWGIADMGYTTMTEVQRRALPILLEGREVMAKAPTGTGKTLAFGLP
ncbi:MAG: DEAD/DEAH box helicase, partial [Clostridiales bacterium]|nr:DEAD/DEAH box helicase [Clostridiales bacterium]